MTQFADIVPFPGACAGSIRVPGSKSISNRALLLAALCGGKVALSGILRSDDVDLMVCALESLGVGIEANEDKTAVVVRGCAGAFPVKQGEIYVGNAGTVARFLTTLMAMQRGSVYEMDGSEAMRGRPMGELIDFLIKNGARFTFAKENGCFPFTMESSGLEDNVRELNATKSSQVISAALMVAPLLSNQYKLEFKGGTVSVPFVDMTLAMMTSFSPEGTFDYELRSESASFGSQGYREDDFSYEIEPDATAASYFMTLPLAVGGRCRLEGVFEKMLQGDSVYAGVLREVGLEVRATQVGIECTFADACRGGDFDFNDFSDTFLSLAAVSPLLSGPLTIRGIAHTRKQETDRVAGMANELRKLGQGVEESEDRLTIKPNLNKLKELGRNGLEIETYEDHRFAMSFSILGSCDLLEDGRSWLRIKNPLCCAKTYPSFFEDLELLRKSSTK